MIQTSPGAQTVHNGDPPSLAEGFAVPRVATPMEVVISIFLDVTAFTGSPVVSIRLADGSYWYRWMAQTLTITATGKYLFQVRVSDVGRIARAAVSFDGGTLTASAIVNYAF